MPTRSNSAHRYRTSNGFDNPSVYCADLLKLVSHIDSHRPMAAMGLPGIPAHALAAPDLAALAAGGGSAAVVTQLADAQQSLLRAMLGSVYQAASTAGLITADLSAAWSLLTTLDRAQPKTLGTVLRHPFVRAWAVRCLEQLRSPAARPDPDAPAPVRRPLPGLGHLGVIAAAAAVRARAPAAVTVPVVDSAVHLPTLGRLSLGISRDCPSADAPAETAALRVLSDAVVVESGQASWTFKIADLLTGEPGTAAAGDPAGVCEPVRVLRAPGLSVAVEDTDPYRHCYPWPAAPRLTDAEFARWQTLVAAAWQEIEDMHGFFAPGLATGLTTLVPLSGVPDDRQASATSRHAPGTVALALPADPVTLAMLLIAGFQQVKIDAVMDLYDLYDPADDRMFPAPCGEGKQHLNSLFRDAYAHLAGVHFWRARLQSAPGPQAARSLARLRAGTLEGIQTLVGSGSLTSLGTTFVEGMRDSARS